MLARIVDARATRDLDFAASDNPSAESALEEMKQLAAIDLGDWCHFELTKYKESLDENGYSRLLKLRFATYVGSEEKDPILIDLSLDCSPTLPPERITPVNRTSLPGIEACDYLAYSLTDQLADKFCAIMERQPGDRPSSRMKDLVDVVICALNKDVYLGQLSTAMGCECVKRKMETPEQFEAPSEWKESFAIFAKKCNVPTEYCTFADASKLASRFFNPALSRTSLDASQKWDHTSLRWA